jgi:ESCRT-II complex subunit VPS36
LHGVNTKATTSQSNLEDALQDLEALMVKAREMVRVAEDLNERLSASSAAAAATATPNGTTTPSAVEPEEATFIRSSLAQLGLQMQNAPVTQDMIKDERKWFEELAKELAGVLQGRSHNISNGSKSGGDTGGMMKKRGIVGMDEVWGGWNRARGVGTYDSPHFHTNTPLPPRARSYVPEKTHRHGIPRLTSLFLTALIPPSTFLQVLPHLPAFTSPPIHARTFTSGLSVLHTPPFTRAAFSSRLVSQLTMGEWAKRV